ncbi:hypothetical protein BHM03_00019076, partial [Ensete ventricosum]
AKELDLVAEHVSDDSWCDDGLLNEISDADLNREQKRRYDQFYTVSLQSINDIAFVSLPDQFKEKLVKKLEDRGRFQSLYKPVQEISTDDALG